MGFRKIKSIFYFIKFSVFFILATAFTFSMVENLTIAPIMTALLKIKAFAKTHIPENELKNPKTIFIVTTWRSGSSFLVQVLNSHPAIFYHHEALTDFQFSLRKEDLGKAQFRIRSLATCDYVSSEPYVRWIQKSPKHSILNNKIRKFAMAFSEKHLDEHFLTEACQSFPAKLFKFERLRISDVQQIFQEIPNSHIIFLVRDPRAIAVSRLKLLWCQEVPACGTISNLCEALNSDWSTFKNLQVQYPKRLHLLRFEDLTSNSSIVVPKLFEKLGISWSPSTDKYLKEYAGHEFEPNTRNIHHRVSKLCNDHWKDEISFDYLKKLDEHCDEFMKDFKYEKLVPIRPKFEF